MSEAKTTRLAIGDEVRVHFHPPGSWKSFSEGVVRRVDVTTQAGRFFVLEVRNEILLDQPHRIRSNFHDYVQYECRNDFPGRIEVLRPQNRTWRGSPRPLRYRSKPPTTPCKRQTSPTGEMDVHSEPEAEQIHEAETVSAPSQVDVERQPVRKQGGLLAALFGRRG